MSCRYHIPNKTGRRCNTMPNWCDADLTVSVEYCPKDATKEQKAQHAKAKEQLKEFRDFAQSKDKDGEAVYLTTEKFIPYPKKFRDMDKKAADLQEAQTKKREAAGYKDMTPEQAEAWNKANPFVWPKDGFNSGGYDWCLKNWGTKWGICHSELREDSIESNWGPELRYGFETAWSPCNPVILAMSKKFPLLNFDYRYFECGCAFNGWLECKGGEQLHNKSGDYFGDRGG
jgi:hypothetical protein